MAEKTKENYIDNKKFYEEMIKLHAEFKSAKEQELPRPKINNYVAGCMMKIAKNLSNMNRFKQYPFKEEMICDGIENCIRYIDRFDPEKSTNPFAYFTQITYYAFIRRIKTEKEYLYTKFAITDHVNLTSETSDRQEHDIGEDFGDDIKMSDYTEEHRLEFMEGFERYKRNKKKRVVDDVDTTAKNRFFD